MSGARSCQIGNDRQTGPAERDSTLADEQIFKFFSAHHACCCSQDARCEQSTHASLLSLLIFFFRSSSRERSIDTSKYIFVKMVVSFPSPSHHSRDPPRAPPPTAHHSNQVGEWGNGRGRCVRFPPSPPHIPIQSKGTIFLKSRDSSRVKQATVRHIHTWGGSSVSKFSSGSCNVRVGVGQDKQGCCSRTPRMPRPTLFPPRPASPRRAYLRAAS